MATDLDTVRRIGAPDHWLAVVATTRGDGSVHASLVNAGLLAHPVTHRTVAGLVVRGDARKLAHLRRTRRATLVWRDGWAWASVEGPADLAGPDDALDGFDPAGLPRLLRAVFAGAGGTHDDWDAYDRVMAAERRTAVLVHPARVLGTG